MRSHAGAGLPQPAGWQSSPGVSQLSTRAGQRPPPASSEPCTQQARALPSEHFPMWLHAATLHCTDRHARVSPRTTSSSWSTPEDTCLDSSRVGLLQQHLSAGSCTDQRITVTSVSLPPFVSRRGLSNTNQRLSLPTYKPTSLSQRLSSGVAHVGFIKSNQRLSLSLKSRNDIRPYVYVGLIPTGCLRLRCRTVTVSDGYGFCLAVVQATPTGPTFSHLSARPSRRTLQVLDLMSAKPRQG